MVEQPPCKRQVVCSIQTCGTISRCPTPTMKRRSRAQAAKRLGLTQSKLNDLLRGKIDKFSLALLIMVINAGMQVEIRVRKAA